MQFVRYVEKPHTITLSGIDYIVATAKVGKQETKISIPLKEFLRLSKEYQK